MDNVPNIDIGFIFFFLLSSIKGTGDLCLASFRYFHVCYLDVTNSRNQSHKEEYVVEVLVWEVPVFQLEDLGGCEVG